MGSFFLFVDDSNFSKDLRIWKNQSFMNRDIEQSLGKHQFLSYSYKQHRKAYFSAKLGVKLKFLNRLPLHCI